MLNPSRSSQIYLSISPYIYITITINHPYHFKRGFTAVKSTLQRLQNMFPWIIFCILCPQYSYMGAILSVLNKQQYNKELLFFQDWLKAYKLSGKPSCFRPLQLRSPVWVLIKFNTCLYQYINFTMFLALSGKGEPYSVDSIYLDIALSCTVNFEKCGYLSTSIFPTAR